MSKQQMERLGHIKTPGIKRGVGNTKLALTLFFSGLLLSQIAGTQYVAYHLGYNSLLGSPWFTLAGHGIYNPLLVWNWILNLGKPPAPGFVADTLDNGMSVIVVGYVGALLAAFALRMRREVVEESDLHGSAGWATLEEIKEAALLSDSGVYVGSYHDKKTNRQVYLKHDGPEHILAFAPTRSGKGVGLVIPTLLAWRHSVLVHDIKGENYAITAGWRKKLGHKILKFEPTSSDGSCARFNPLDEIRIGTEHEVKDVQNIATMIVDPDGKGMADHWAKTGFSLLVGTILHVLYSKDIKDKTLRGVAAYLSDPRWDDSNQMYEAMINELHDEEGVLGWTDLTGQATRTHPVVAQSAKDMLNKSANEQSGVLSTAMSFLSLYRDPIVANNTSCSDWKIRDLMNHDVPCALYLVVSPSDKDRLRPLIRLIISQVVRTLTEKMEFKGGRSVAGYKHRLLLLIDEFPALGKIDILEEALAFIAGYGMKCYLIAQDLTQLQKAYTKDESIVSNCHIRIAYAPNKIETAKSLSDMLGQTTAIYTQLSYSTRPGTNIQTSVSVNEQQQARALMTPDEVMRLRGPEKDAQGNVLKPGDMIIMIANRNPVLGMQILYFKDPVLSKRSQIEAPATSDRLHGEDAPATPATPPPPAPAEAAATPEASETPEASAPAPDTSNLPEELQHAIAAATQTDAPAAEAEATEPEVAYSDDEMTADELEEDYTLEAEVDGIDPADFADDLTADTAYGEDAYVDDIDEPADAVAADEGSTHDRARGVDDLDLEADDLDRDDRMIRDDDVDHVQKMIEDERLPI
jgi:type IV secretion system protein VirD4